MSDEFEAARMLGVNHGLVHALVAMGTVRRRVVYPHYLPPRRHNRLRAAKLAEVKALDIAIDIVENQLRSVREKQQEMVKL